MKRVALALCLALAASLPGSAYAQALRVQSGEHAAFTRIVIPWGNDRPWVATRDQSKVTLDLEGHTQGFDVGRVFDRVPRTRISDLGRDGDSLVVSLNCNCDVAAFANGKGFIVIDVADAGRTIVAPLEVATVPDVVLVEQAPSLRPEPVPVPMPWIAEQLEAGRKAARTAPEPQIPAPSPAADPLALQVPSSEQISILNELQRRLVEEVGSATTRGVLEPAQERLPSLLSLEETVTPAQQAQNQTVPDEPRQVKATQNLRITTSRDIPAEQYNNPSLSISSGNVCPSEQEAMVEEWGDDRSFGAQISTHRNNLYGEFDRLDPDALKKLVRLYLYFGFGAEATQLLKLYPDTLNEDPILHGIAEIMEKGHASAIHQLDTLMDCDSNIALWAILSSKKLPEGALVNKAAALRALNRLPRHLRKFLAPELSTRFLDFGDANGAATAMRSIERAPEEMEPEGTLALASIALENGEDVKATEKLESVIKANKVPSPEALLKLVNERLAADQPITPETALLVEAYAQELRDSEMGPELAKAHILSLTRSGQYDAAFEAFDTMSASRWAAAATDIRSKMIAELVTSAGDVVFLDHFFRQPNSVVDDLPWTTKMAAADRLLSLGFAGPAQSVLALLADRPASTARQMLAARVALELGQTNQAVAVLIGVEGAEADQIRAEAALRSGAADEASVLFARAKQPEAAAETAWLAEDWANLTSQDTPIFGPMAELAALDAEVALESEGMLARTSAAVDESVSAREAIGALLNALDIEAISEQPELQ